MKRIKYPHTPHLPFSEGVTNDDKVLKSLSHFTGKEVVITEKMDGENTTLYSDYSHARSIDSKNHPSRNLLKQFHASISKNIFDGYRVCGENMYAKHSIRYDDLAHHFLGFSMWNDRNECMSWDDTVELFELIGITSVPVLWRGIFDEDVVRKIVNELDLTKQEGIVVRIASSFAYNDFGLCVCKWVRKGHVQTDKHWMNSEIVMNKWSE